MNHSTLTVVAMLKAKPGKDATLKQALLALIAPTRKEPGCVNYDLHQSADDPMCFLFHENWTSKQHLDDHLACRTWPVSWRGPMTGWLCRPRLRSGTRSGEIGWAVRLSPGITGKEVERGASLTVKLMSVKPKTNHQNRSMKRSFAVIAVVASLVLFANATSASAKDVSISGEAKCAKCMLHEGDKCQTVIQVTKKGKTQTYYVMDNEVSKGFHKDVCHSAEKVKASGTVKTVDGKKELTLTKIDLAKE
jgi:quinol monooxygenase YgiN